MDAERRSQWPRGLWRRSAAARMLRLWVRIPPEAWTSVLCVSCVLYGRGLCDELTTRPEESYRVWCVAVWSRNLVNEKALAHWGLSRQKQTDGCGTMSVRISFVSLKVAQGNKIIMAELCSHKLHLLVRMLWTNFPISYLTFLSVMCWMFINSVPTLVYAGNPVPHYNRVHSIFQINISQNLNSMAPFF